MIKMYQTIFLLAIVDYGYISNNYRTNILAY